jgi:DNA-binding MarR family transcriptional regulator
LSKAAKLEAGLKQTARPMDESVFFKLVRIVNLTARPFHEGVGRDHHLSLNEWRCLMVIAAHPGISASEVVEHTGLDKMSVSRAVSGLASDGRITKEPDPSDLRKTHLALSQSGQALFDDIAPAAREREAQLFADLGADELVALNALLDRMALAVR